MCDRERRCSNKSAGGGGRGDVIVRDVKTLSLSEVGVLALVRAARSQRENVSRVVFLKSPTHASLADSFIGV
jgi:hypothetical protein